MLTFTTFRACLGIRYKNYFEIKVILSIDQQIPIPSCHVTTPKIFPPKPYLIQFLPSVHFSGEAA